MWQGIWKDKRGSELKEGFINCGGLYPPAPWTTKPSFFLLSPCLPSSASGERPEQGKLRPGKLVCSHLGWRKLGALTVRGSHSDFWFLVVLGLELKAST
jgi:hypothetical protein